MLQSANAELLRNSSAFVLRRSLDELQVDEVFVVHFEPLSSLRGTKKSAATKRRNIDGKTNLLFRVDRRQSTGELDLVAVLLVL